MNEVRYVPLIEVALLLLLCFYPCRDPCTIARRLLQIIRFIRQMHI